MRRLGFTLALVVVTLIIFGAVITHDFVGWDDYDTIASNDWVRSPSWAGVRHYWTNAAGGLYVPLTYTVWLVVGTIAQIRTPAGALELNPAIFHAVSLVIHVASVVMVFDLLERLLRSDAAIANRKRGSRVAAFIGAMLFAIHPLQVETVAWASGLKDLLGGLLALAAIRQYVIYASEQRRLWRLGLAIGLQILAMLAKPVTVVVPFLVAAIDIWIIGRPIRRVVGSAWPMVLVAIPCVIWSRLAQDQYNELYTPLWTRPFIAADALGFYLRKLVFPYPLALLYDRTPIAVVQSGVIYYAWILPAIVAFLVLLNHKRMPVVVAASAMFVAALLPMLGFTNFMMQVHSTVTDHYMYLPMFAVALAVAWGVSKYETRFVYGLSAIVLIALAAMSFVQLQTWQDSVTVFAHAQRFNPDSPGANGNLGMALARAGRLEEAIPYLQKAASLSPRSGTAQGLLAQALIQLNRFEEAIEPATEALNLAKPGADTTMEHFQLGRAYLRLDRLREAERHFAAAARQRPDDRNLAADLESIRQKLAMPATAPSTRFVPD